MTREKRIYIIAGVAAIVLWHVVISSRGDKKIDGLFSAVPKAGYTWIDGSKGSRYFWNSLKAEWRMGQPHPKYKAVSAISKDTWLPFPGYAYRNNSDLASIYWQSGLSHPSYKIVSSMAEGRWLPQLGYQFKYPGTTNLEVVWTPGLDFSALKMTSGDKPDEWKPYPGYELKKEGNILKAKWKEGLLDPANRELISGEDEGEWLSIDEEFEDTDYDISVTFPDCDYTVLTKILYRSYTILNPASGKIESIFQKNLLDGSKWLMDKLIGGMPVAGKLTITKNYLEYEPGDYATWFISGETIRQFRIPATDIKSVSRDDYVTLGIITIKTDLATIKFIRNGKFIWESPGSAIRDKIDLMLAYNQVSY